MKLAEFIEYPKSGLLLTGIWPEKNPSIFYRCKTYITLILSVLLCICMFINVGYNCQNFLTLSKSLYLTMSVSYGTSKELALVFKGWQFHKLLEMLNISSFTEYLTVCNSDFKYYLYTVKIITIGFKIQVVGCLVGMTLFPVNEPCVVTSGRFSSTFHILYNLFIVSLMMKAFVTETYVLFNILNHYNSGANLMENKPLPIDFPFYNNGTYHYPFYMFQMVAVSLVAYHNMVVDLLVAGLFAVAAVQLKVLNKKLEETHTNVKKLIKYSEESKEENTFSYLRECCIHYSDIEQFVIKTVRMFSVIFIIQLGASSIAICNTGMIILTISPMSIEAISLFFYLTAMFLEVGLYCWFGNDVYFQSYEVNTACYMTKWYENGPKVRKILIILMERTKRPLEIKGVGYVTLSFRTFIGILKWSYSYFTLLRNFTYKEGQANVET